MLFRQISANNASITYMSVFFYSINGDDGNYNLLVAYCFPKTYKWFINVIGFVRFCLSFPVINWSENFIFLHQNSLSVTTHSTDRIADTQEL